MPVDVFLYPPRAGDWAHLFFLKKYQLSLLVGTVKGQVTQESPGAGGGGVQREGLPHIGLANKDPSPLCLLTDSD